MAVFVLSIATLPKYAHLPKQMFFHVLLSFAVLSSTFSTTCDAGALHPKTFANSSSTEQRITSLAFGSCMDQAHPHRILCSSLPLFTNNPPSRLPPLYLSTLRSACITATRCWIM
jgi:hypothetical protein